MNGAPIWKADNTIDPSSPGVATVNSVQYYLNGMGQAAKFGFPRGLVKNDYNTIQPRVGFSEDLFGNGKTVLRGGFGTFFERLQGNDIYNAATSPPFAYNLGLNNTLLSSPATDWQKGTTVSGFPVFAAGVTSLAKDYRAPATAQFSFGIQHELTPSVVWVVQYVGNMEWHQNVDRNINTFSPTASPVTIPEPASKGGGTATVALACLGGDGGNHYGESANGKGDGPYHDDLCNPGFASFAGGSNAFRIFQGYGGITQQENTTNGNYHGFQTGLRLQNKWGLSGELDYTYSHEIDVTSNDLQTISNPWNLKYDKGSGGFDRRHIVNANYVYKLPFLNKSKSLLSGIAGGWEIAGTVIDESGVPTAPTLSANYDPIGLNGGYTNRPNISGKMSYPKKFGQWFDTSKFSMPTPSWLGGPALGFGNGGRDSIVGPGRVNFTTSLYKSFPVTERAHFELRFESFNTFNHTQFNNINTGAPQWPGAKGNNSNFGFVTSTWDPRVMELGGKFVF